MECGLDIVSGRWRGGVNLANVQKIDAKMENELPAEGRTERRISQV